MERTQLYIKSLMREYIDANNLTNVLTQGRVRWSRSTPFSIGSVGSMPLQFLEIGSHVENHAIEWHDFQHDTQFHGVVVA